MKRGQTSLNFLIGINKPKGMTSHDVVNCVRNITGEGRVGHMGTLDPMATGVLLVGVGSAARLNSYLENHDKTYIATITFGKSTNTYDAEGQVTKEFEIPAEISDKTFATKFVGNLIGKHVQTPPEFSAIKIDGKPAYKQARQGKEVELPKRKIEIFSAELLEIKENSWVVKLEVSKGTYIRSIANDIGQELNTGAFLSDLSRERVGQVSLDNCYSIQDFELAYKQGEYNILNCAELLDFEIVEADEKMLKRISNGRSLGMDQRWNMFPGSKISLVDNNQFLAIYRADTLIDLNCECKFAQPILLTNKI